jgi:hypothetical protein
MVWIVLVELSNHIHDESLFSLQDELLYAGVELQMNFSEGEPA